MCCTRLAENTGRKKSLFWHHRTTLSGCIFAAEACIDNRKKNLSNIDTSPTCPDNMVNFGLLTPEICWRVWGTPANFNGFHVLATLLHGTLVVSVSQLCGVEQRASPIFGRVTITLGIGPHSSFILILFSLLLWFLVSSWCLASHIRVATHPWLSLNLQLKFWGLESAWKWPRCLKVLKKSLNSLTATNFCWCIFSWNWFDSVLLVAPI